VATTNGNWAPRLLVADEVVCAKQLQEDVAPFAQDFSGMD
jgi:hypothetical protein